jgi:hypothetical protein
MPTPAGSDEIQVSVERITDGEAKLSRSDERMFSLASAMPSKRATAWLLSLLVLGVFLAWPIKAYYDRQQAEAASKFHPDSMWSSGKLSQVHGALENNCQACHVKPFEAVREEAARPATPRCTTMPIPIRSHALSRILDQWGR